MSRDDVRAPANVVLGLQSWRLVLFAADPLSTVIPKRNLLRSSRPRAAMQASGAGRHQCRGKAIAGSGDGSRQSACLHSIDPASPTFSRDEPRAIDAIPDGTRRDWAASVCSAGSPWSMLGRGAAAFGQMNVSRPLGGIFPVPCVIKPASDILCGCKNISIRVICFVARIGCMHSLAAMHGNMHPTVGQPKYVWLCHRNCAFPTRSCRIAAEIPAHLVDLMFSDVVQPAVVAGCKLDATFSTGRVAG